ncbi:hypothetical protein [Methylobacterium sp. Leaf89]|uniref:hypothetical protein n=1 Tax=Methylobacterium sp. Leaf89 TaxID=1736245 RepID=UPI0012E7D593|nr:hypothetical protein [Methylobacterium sp. Leaf89]
MTTSNTREKMIASNYQNRKTHCKQHGVPFSITKDEWLAAWSSHPQREGSGYVVKRDEAGEWVASNICFKPMKAKAPNTPRPTTVRTLTVRQWAREMRAQR